MRRIRSQPDLEQCHSAGLGLIYNDFVKSGASAKDNNVLHAAGCLGVKLSKARQRKLFFADLNEAITWLEGHRDPEGQGWRRCDVCEAIGPPAPSEAASESLADSKPWPFTEKEVEALLVEHLQHEGFVVKRRVKVPGGSGIIDLIATGPDETLVVEVKGEDRGGYTSAHMNLLLGVGQIASRMTDEQRTYALAVPRTRDFEEALKEYRGSVGIERLGLDIFLVNYAGTVTRHDAAALSSFITHL